MIEQNNLQEQNKWWIDRLVAAGIPMLKNERMDNKGVYHLTTACKYVQDRRAKLMTRREYVDWMHEQGIEDAPKNYDEVQREAIIAKYGVS